MKQDAKIFRKVFCKALKVSEIVTEYCDFLRIEFKIGKKEYKKRIYKSLYFEINKKTMLRRVDYS